METSGLQGSGSKKGLGMLSLRSEGSKTAPRKWGTTAWSMTWTQSQDKSPTPTAGS